MPPATNSPTRKRIQPIRAFRAVRALIQNPDDTPKVFDIIDALSGNAGERLFRRFRRSATGERILRERRNLLATLDDRAALKALPAGSLGRVYADFVEREQITGQGLADASMANRRDDIDPDRRLFFDRLRDMHDLWHVATGYGRDLVGEGALLAFSYAQTKNRGVGFIVAVAWLRARGEMSFARGIMWEGWRRGRRARWLPGEDWEHLLTLPLAAVREQLCLGTPPSYAQVRSAGAPALA
ncbi:MAG TPA: Coq4 family protein [Candidatus Binatia bacterium]|nr:Coq4 family protein [Candidatus Binatia bacterium]